MRRGNSLVVVAIIFAALQTTAGASERIDFSRDVLPLLRRACWECHGEKKQEGGLRLDDRDLALRGGDSGPVFQPGSPDASELLRRIRLPRHDPEVMPSRGEPLTGRQIAVIRQWILEGAAWPADAELDRHWAYETLRTPKFPEVKNSHWPKTPIDYFVLSRLEQEGLAPSPPAQREQLLRRVYLDLIGLPPSPEEVDSFLSDRGPQAFERVVDRLLASDQFGVRWARPWLDYARYADSHGFQRDDFRDLWAYRDWVVDAFNSDLPYDQFSIQQIAGDLLPNPTDSQRIATGFHRSAPTNVEAGSDPEETRTNQVFDRVNTLGTIWLGSTLECAQCHDHKYDPFTQRDYYRLFACFNQTEIEADRSNPKVPGSIRFLGPEMALPDSQMERRRSELAAQLHALKEEIGVDERNARELDEAWEQQLATQVADLPRETVLEVHAFDSLGGATHEILPDHSVLLSGESPDRDTYTIVVRTNLTGIRAFKLETMTDPSLPGEGPGRGDEARPNFVLNTFRVEISPQNGGSKSAVSFKGATADFAQGRYPVQGAVDDDPKTAWAINPRFHQPHWAVFETAEPLGIAEGAELTFQLVQDFGGARTIGRLRLKALTGAVGKPSLPVDVAEALAAAPDKRTEKQRQALASYRLQASAAHQDLVKRQKNLEAELKQLKLPSTLVMKELEKPRSSFVLLRGDFRSPGDPVEPGVPAVLTHEPTLIQSRLDLAHWLFQEDNPLVARVAVNRWWSEIFGHGIVSTPEDFGMKGEPPTHPELLDWLAVEYQRQGWSLKSILRTIVLSSTYQQSSRVTAELLAVDDQNVLYARGPRLRLDAEAIRDQALAVGGLLSLQRGGPSIRPYQPDGLWVKVGGQRYDYEVSAGEKRHRRGLYVVLKRAAPYPSFVNFDANNRMACRVRRPRSNTPLQALTLLNDPVYVEAAVAFAGRLLGEREKASDVDRLHLAFRIMTARTPNERELTALATLLESQRQSAKDAPGVKQFVERWPAPSGVDAAEFSAWYSVCAALLNLDESITKP